MIVLAKALGMLTAILGITVFANPATLKKLLTFLKQGKRLRLAGVIRLLTGIILLLAASKCRIVWPIALMGILSIIGGVVVFSSNIDKLKSWLEWWLNKSDMIVRLWSIAAFAFGIIIIYCA